MKAKSDSENENSRGGSAATATGFGGAIAVLRTGAILEFLPVLIFREGGGDRHLHAPDRAALAGRRAIVLGRRRRRPPDGGARRGAAGRACRSPGDLRRG